MDSPTSNFFFEWAFHLKACDMTHDGVTVKLIHYPRIISRCAWRSFHFKKRVRNGIWLIQTKDEGNCHFDIFLGQKMPFSSGGNRKTMFDVSCRTPTLLRLILMESCYCWKVELFLLYARLFRGFIECMLTDS